MLVVFVLVSVYIFVGSDKVLPDQRILMPFGTHDKENDIVPCVGQILKKYYVNEKLLTFVDMDYDDDRVLQAVHVLAILNVVSRKPISRYYQYNTAYLLTAGNVTNFTEKIIYLTQEPSWNPDVKFIIIFRIIKEVELGKIFDLLIKYHVLNVLVINASDLVFYTYNPYEDYACGKYYNRIINFGRCPTSADIFPNKLTTGLKRCNLIITVPHWPPYTMHPTKVKPGMLPKGLEQFMMDTIAKKEGFNITYIYKDNGEEFSTVSLQMIATGPLAMLQNNETDLVMGGMVLSPLRAAAFSYISSHLDVADDMKIVVKRASYVPVWKNFYLEFEPIVWILLFLSLVVFAMLMILLLQIQDKSNFFLTLSDMLLLHGHNIQCRWMGKCVFIFWVWFAYLMNCFYQSNLSSLTIKPGRETQVSDPIDIHLLNIKPCLSSVISKLLLMERNITIPFHNHTECESFFDSIKAVSKSDKLFTIVVYSVYYYEKHQFYDQYGNNLLYSFKNTLYKVSYSIYMRKGFPLKHRLNLLMLRLRENGLMQHNYEHQYYMLKLANRYKCKETEARFVAPWYLYSFGLFVAFIVLLAEIVSKL